MLTPYAKILASINAGGNVSGGIDIPSACTIALSGESTVGWTQQRWEFVDYPEGWATPSGWSIDADGTIYSTAVTPTTITMPANTVVWGSWALRLRVNQQVSSSADIKLGLIDNATRFDMPSPKGQRDIGALEEGQFTTTTTAIKQWARSYQRNLRVLEGLVGGGGGWTTVLDLDFKAASTQNLDTPGTYVIGGKSWKAEANSFGRQQVDLTNGTGLVIQTKTGASGYGPFIGSSDVKNAPLIWLPLSQLAIPNIDWTTQFRIWLSVSNQTITAGSTGATGVFWGIDNDRAEGSADTDWYSLVGGRSATSTTQTAILAAIGYGDWNTGPANANITGLTTWDPTKAGTTRLDLHSLLPDANPSVHFGPAYSGAWPTTLVPWVQAVEASGQSGRAGQIGWANDPSTPVALDTRLGIVIGAANSDAFTHADTATITRVRVDYKL